MMLSTVPLTIPRSASCGALSLWQSWLCARRINNAVRLVAICIAAGSARPGSVRPGSARLGEVRGARRAAPRHSATSLGSVELSSLRRRASPRTAPRLARRQSVVYCAVLSVGRPGVPGLPAVGGETRSRGRVCRVRRRRWSGFTRGFPVCEEDLGGLSVLRIKVHRKRARTRNS